MLGTTDSELHEPRAVLDDFRGCLEAGFLIEGEVVVGNDENAELVPELLHVHVRNRVKSREG